MRYDNLHDLVTSSGSSRSYFLSLPVEMQLQLHEHNDYIHSAADLHSRVNLIQKHNKAVALSDCLDRFFS